DDPDGEPVFNRTVSANLGMSYSISNVVAEAGLANVLRWLTDVGVDEGELRNRIKNKMIRPTTIPETAEALAFEQAVAREALRLAYEQHRAFATTLRGVQRTRTVGDTFDQSGGGASVVDPMTLDLLIGSGGVLSHAPDPRQTAMMLIDAFRPKGVTRLAKDRIFMMPHLGVLAGVHERAAVEVFEADCLTYLGTHVAPVGGQRSKKLPALRYELEHGGTPTAGSVRHGQIEVVDLPDGESATLTATPCNGGDLGGGRNRAVSVTVSGGAAGLILDGRVAPE
ncbi:MAG: glutamate mutase L, partial [Planctomycetota bacterium]